MTRDEADEALAQAIRNHATIYDLVHDDELLGDYAVVAHWQRVEADGAHRYTLAFHQPEIPDHIARGLFTTALDNMAIDVDED